MTRKALIKLTQYLILNRVVYIPAKSTGSHLYATNCATKVQPHITRLPATALLASVNFWPQPFDFRYGRLIPSPPTYSTLDELNRLKNDSPLIYQAKRTLSLSTMDLLLTLKGGVNIFAVRINFARDNDGRYKSAWEEHAITWKAGWCALPRPTNEAFS